MQGASADKSEKRCIYSPSSQYIHNIPDVLRSNSMGSKRLPLFHLKDYSNNYDINNNNNNNENCNIDISHPPFNTSLTRRLEIP